MHEDEEPADERAWRAPTWRDGAVSLAALVVAAFVVLPACNGPAVRAVRDAVAFGPDLVRVELRLAGGLAAPVALWVLVRRLRRDDAALRPGERYLAHAAAMVVGTLGPLALGATGGWALVVGAATSVLLGPWLLAPSWWWGAWLGLRTYGLTLVGGGALAVLTTLVMGVVPMFVVTALDLSPAAAWVAAWFDTLVPTTLTAVLALAAWASAAEYDAMPDRPPDASLWRRRDAAPTPPPTDDTGSSPGRPT